MEAVKTNKVPNSILGNNLETFTKIYRAIYFGRIEARKRNAEFTFEITGRTEQEVNRKRREHQQYIRLLKELRRYGFVPHGFKRDETIRWLIRDLPVYNENQNEGPEPIAHFVDESEIYKEDEKFEDATMDERAVRVAAFRLSTRGLISPDSAFRIQKEISDRLTSEGRGGLCRGPDIHLAMGAGSKEMSEDMTELDSRANYYEKEIMKTA